MATLWTPCYEYTDFYESLHRELITPMDTLDPSPFPHTYNTQNVVL